MIVATRDGGETWVEQASGTTELLNGVDFVDLATGWAVGDNGVIVATRDGGETWVPAGGADVFSYGETTPDFRDVDFVDPSAGWVVSSAPGWADDGVIAETRDGGETWVWQWVTGEALRSADFIDPATGWAVGDTGVIVAPRDGS